MKKQLGMRMKRETTGILGLLYSVQVSQVHPLSTTEM